MTASASPLACTLRFRHPKAERNTCGLPVLVSDEGGPREMMDDGVSGRVLPGNDAAAWVAAIDQLLDDAPLRSRMSRTAASGALRFSLERSFEQFWADHLAALAPVESETKRDQLTSHARH